MAVKNFKEILAWQKSHKLVLLTYKLTDHFPKKEDFCLTNQIRRAAISIPSNIAEGYKRHSAKDSGHFYNIAEGSLEELKYQMLLAKDLDYLTLPEFSDFSSLADEAGKLLFAWKNSQKL